MAQKNESSTKDDDIRAAVKRAKIMEAKFHVKDNLLRDLLKKVVASDKATRMVIGRLLSFVVVLDHIAGFSKGDLLACTELASNLGLPFFEGEVLENVKFEAEQMPRLARA